MLKIGDFSKKTGVSIKTLRYYDEIDLFKPSYSDMFTGYRYYSYDQIIDIEIIIQLKKLNLSLDMIKEYIQTKNIEILNRKKEELEMQIEKITNFVNEKYKNYEIYEGDYKKYVLINGIKQATCPQALEVRDGNAKYYVIEENGEYIDDFVIFTSRDNWITIERKKYLDDAYIDFIIKYLKEKNYKFISEYVPIEMEKIIKHIENKFNSLKKEIVKQGNYEYIKYTINL